MSAIAHVESALAVAVHAVHVADRSLAPAHQASRALLFAAAAEAADFLSAVAADVHGRPCPVGYPVPDTNAIRRASEERAQLGLVDHSLLIHARHLEAAQRHMMQAADLMRERRFPEASGAAAVAARLLLELAVAFGHRGGLGLAEAA